MAQNFVEHNFENCPPDFATLVSSRKILSDMFATQIECSINLKFSLSFMLVFITTSSPVKKYALTKKI